MAIREYLCGDCGYQYEEMVQSQDPSIYRSSQCPHCEAEADLLPAIIGGYNGNMGGSSTRPKNSTSMKSKKAFTGNGRLEFDFPKKVKE